MSWVDNPEYIPDEFDQYGDKVGPSEEELRKAYLKSDPRDPIIFDELHEFSKRDLESWDRAIKALYKNSPIKPIKGFWSASTADTGPASKKGTNTLATKTKSKTKQTSSKRGKASDDDDDEDDPWALGSGMADDFDGYISEPFFGVDDEYNADALLFNATLVDEDGEPITTLKYSVGQGWETDDDGEEIEHPSRSKISENGRYGRFIARLIGEDDEKAPKHKSVISPKGKGNGLGLAKLLKKRGSPFKASTYDGLGFHWDLHEMETMGKDDDGNPITRQVLLPTAYLGEYENGTSAKKGPKKGKDTGKGKVSKKSKADEDDEDEDEDEEEEDLSASIPNKLKKSLTSLAQSGSAKEFVRAAAKDKAVIALPDEVMEYILDAGKDGFHASVQEDEEDED